MQRPKRPCARPGCPALVAKGYCPRCAPQAAAIQQQYEFHRGHSAQRGYDSAWRRFRDWFLSQPENIVCVDCQRNMSTDVHHLQKLRDYPELRLTPSNCRGLCRSCHNARSARGE